MKSTIILLTGIVVGATAFAATDAMAEERYRIKYGRYTPAEEARRATRTEVSQDTAGACCRTHPSIAAVMTDAPGQEARFAAKYGRLTPQAEARKRRSDAGLAAHVKECVEIGQCSRMHGATAVKAVAPSGQTDADLRLRAKYGQTAPTHVRQDASSQERQLIASTQTGGCEHECCKHGE